MQKTIFREYDIRGKVGSELILDQVYDLGRAIATFFLQKDERTRTVVVGMDGRVHSEQIKNSLLASLQDAGLNVIFIGLCPTPVMYFAVHTLKVDAGLMITASHNTKEYNGIKMCFKKQSVWGQEIQTIQDIFYAGSWRTRARVGTCYQRDIISTYIAWLKAHFYHLVDCDLPVVFDCAHGAAGTVMPALIKAMGWKHAQLMYEAVDGTFPAHEADPVVDKNAQDLKQRVCEDSMQLGIGFDGDCDRMAPVTHEGELVMGDKLLALFADEYLQEHINKPIVFDVKCSSGLIEKIQKGGGRPCISATGHSIIKNRMKKENALLGGELSCHFFFADRYFGYDDGFYAALRLLSLIKQSGQSLAMLVHDFPQRVSTPEIRLACPHVDTKDIICAVEQAFKKQPEANIMTIDGVRVSTSYGWGLIRSSNTQPVISLRFESNCDDGLSHIKHDFMHVLTQFFDKHALARSFDE